MKKQTVTIKTNEENPEPMEIIAQSIIQVSDAFVKIQKSRLSQRAIMLLIKDTTGLAMRDIEIVLNAVPKLKDIYLKKIAAK